MLLNAWKSQGYSFWVIKEKLAGVGEVKLPLPTPTPHPTHAEFTFFVFRPETRLLGKFGPEEWKLSV